LRSTLCVHITDLTLSRLTSFHLNLMRSDWLQPWGTSSPQSARPSSQWLWPATNHSALSFSRIRSADTQTFLISLWMIPWRWSLNVVHDSKLTTRKLKVQQKLEAQMNRLVLTKDQRLADECLKPQYQSPCKPGQVMSAVWVVSGSGNSDYIVYFSESHIMQQNLLSFIVYMLFV